ncbi:MAG: type II toxin-antitoxin system HicB family antitoxin [Candidatus Shapirobacteria bacterium]
MTPWEYLKLPYSFCFVYDNGNYTSYVREFPGCVAEGDGLEETWIALHGAAYDCIEATLDLGQEIPEPLTTVWK